MTSERTVSIVLTETQADIVMVALAIERDRVMNLPPPLVRMALSDCMVPS